MKPRSEFQLPCACAAVRHAARLVTRIYEEELREHLAVPQFALLSVLEHRPGCSQATLVAALDLDKTTLSRNLKLIRKNGWIEPWERGYRLTAVGGRLLQKAKPAWQRAQTRLRSAMPDEGWNDMWQAFTSVTNAAHKALQEQN